MNTCFAHSLDGHQIKDAGFQQLWTLLILPVKAFVKGLCCSDCSYYLYTICTQQVKYVLQTVKKKIACTRAF